ncbi:MAG: hypothetical protein AB7K08_13200 [Microbacteriaceae bacterium]
MNPRATRLARGSAVGVIATAAAALSHAVAGGGTPSALALAVGVVFGGMLGTFSLSARPSLPRLTVAVGVTQLVFHMVFSTLGSAAPVEGHVHGAVVLAQATPHTHVDSPLMWLSHAAAGILTLVFLRRAEQAAWQLVRGFVRRIAAPFRPAAPVPMATRVMPLPSEFPVRLLGRLLISTVSGRGPPAPVAY